MHSQTAVVTMAEIAYDDPRLDDLLLDIMDHKLPVDYLVSKYGSDVFVRAVELGYIQPAKGNKAAVHA